MNELKIFNRADEALCYLTECTQATIESLEMKRRPPKGETDRQKNMAEIGLRNLSSCGFTAEHARKIRCFRVAERLAPMPTTSPPPPPESPPTSASADPRPASESAAGRV